MKRSALISVERHFDASAEQVFALLGDHEAFFPRPRFRCRLLEEGASERNGDGALREVRTGALRFVERIDGYRSNQGFHYRICSLHAAGLPVPIRHDGGSIEIHATPAGCRVLWQSRFRMALPLVGSLLARRFQRDASAAFAWLLAEAAKRLAKEMSAGMRHAAASSPEKHA